MDMQTFQHEKAVGWSIPQLPDLDSENALILIFAAPSVINVPVPTRKLSKKHPQSKVMGSSIGNIV